MGGLGTGMESITAFDFGSMLYVINRTPMTTSTLYCITKSLSTGARLRCHHGVLRRHLQINQIPINRPTRLPIQEVTRMPIPLPHQHAHIRNPLPHILRPHIRTTRIEGTLHHHDRRGVTAVVVDRHVCLRVDGSAGEADAGDLGVPCLHHSQSGGCEVAAEVHAVARVGVIGDARDGIEAGDGGALVRTGGVGGRDEAGCVGLGEGGGVAFHCEGQSACETRPAGCDGWVGGLEEDEVLDGEEHLVGGDVGIAAVVEKRSAVAAWGGDGIGGGVGDELGDKALDVCASERTVGAVCAVAPRGEAGDDGFEGGSFADVEVGG